MKSADIRKLTERLSTAQRTGDLPAAAEALDQLCAISPNDPRSWKELARTYQELGRPSETVAALVRAARLHTEAGQGIQAIAVCKWILELDPTHTATIDRMAELQSATLSRKPDVQRARSPRTASNRGSAAPIEALMLNDAVAPTSRPDSEGRREIPIESALPDVLLPDVTLPDATLPDVTLPNATLAKSTRETARGLVSTPMFGRLGAQALRRLIDAAKLVRLAEGEVLFRQGDPADCLYVVAEGAVVPIAENGTRHKLSVLEQGAFFGEIALLTNQPRNATIEALVDSQLLAIDREVIGDLLEEEPEVLALTLRVLRERLVARLLSTSPVFGGIARDERTRLIHAFRLMEVPEGAVLVEQGAPSRALFLVLAGQLRVIDASQTVEKEIATLGAGEPCGEMSLIDDTPAIARVAAARKSWLLLLPRADFERVVASHPGLRDRLESIAATRRGSP